MLVLMIKLLMFCHPFFNRLTKKLIDMFTFCLICSGSIWTVPMAVPMQRTFFNWNLMVCLISLDLAATDSVSPKLKGNLPIFTSTLPRSLGICSQWAAVPMMAIWGEEIRKFKEKKTIVKMRCYFQTRVRQEGQFNGTTESFISFWVVISQTDLEFDGFHEFPLFLGSFCGTFKHLLDGFFHEICWNFTREKKKRVRKEEEGEKRRGTSFRDERRKIFDFYFFKKQTLGLKFINFLDSIKLYLFFELLELEIWKTIGKLNKRILKSQIFLKPKFNWELQMQMKIC